MRHHTVAALALLSSLGGFAAGTTIDDAARVTGIGGVFFKAENPEKLRTWYRQHLGIDATETGADFLWREEDDSDRMGRTVWSIFPKNSDYFGSGRQQLMINYRVNDLNALLARLREQGVRQVGTVEEYWYGRFAWIIDGEGNRVELWEPDQISETELGERTDE